MSLLRKASMPWRPGLPLSLSMVALACLALSCDATDDLDNFDATVRGSTSIAAASPLELLLQDMSLTEDFTRFDLSQAHGFENDKYSKEDVDSVHLESLTMTVLDPPQGQDLAFFGTVIFYVETEGLPRLELARQDTFPQGAPSVAFDITARGDLSPYLLAPAVTVEVEVLDSQRPSRTTTVEVVAVFDVDVDVI